MSADLARRFARDRSGTALVQFALVAPAFFAMLFGLAQFGYAMHCASSVRYALEEASRAVMLDRTTSSAQVQAAVRARLQNLARVEAVTVTLTQETPAAGVTVVHARSAYRHAFSLPFVTTFDLTFRHSVTVTPAG